MLQKRVFDDRILEVDLGPVMRTNDEVEAITRITAVPEGDGAAVTIENITKATLAPATTARGVAFTAGGGSDGGVYELVIRFTTTGAVTQMIEGVIGLRVKD